MNGLLITWGDDARVVRKYRVVKVPRWLGRLLALVVGR